MLILYFTENFQEEAPHVLAPLVPVQVAADEDASFDAKVVGVFDGNDDDVKIRKCICCILLYFFVLYYFMIVSHSAILFCC